jgi:hypothetical protein
MNARPIAVLVAVAISITAGTAGASREARPIFIPLNPSGSSWAVQPSEFRVSRGLTLGYMNWRGWGHTRAIGHGITFVGNNKHGANATVRLSGVKRCEGLRYYAHLAVESYDVSRVDYALIDKYGACKWVWRSSD